MENNKEFSMEEYNNLIKSIKSGSPVHKINFNLENPNAIVGMYLLGQDDIKKYMDKIIDNKDLNNDTLLVFESRHVIECCFVIYGCLCVLKNMSMYKTSYRVFIDQVLDTVLTKPLFFKTLMDELNNITFNLIQLNGSESSSKVYNTFQHIMNYIWFVPYANLDLIAKEAIEEYQKHTEGNNNE